MLGARVYALVHFLAHAVETTLRGGEGEKMCVDVRERGVDSDEIDAFHFEAQFKYMYAWFCERAHIAQKISRYADVITRK